MDYLRPDNFATYCTYLENLAVFISAVMTKHNKTHCFVAAIEETHRSQKHAATCSWQASQIHCRVESK